MDSIVTVDIGSTSMRAVHHDPAGKVLHKCRRLTVPEYYEDKRVELDGRKFVQELLSLLKESYDFARSNKLNVLALSVTSQRSSVVPVDSSGEPLAPFIMWHDKRTVPICRELACHEDRVYQLTGLRISPVLSAVKMTWLRREMRDVYNKTAKMLGVQDIWYRPGRCALPLPASWKGSPGFRKTRKSYPPEAISSAPPWDWASSAKASSSARPARDPTSSPIRRRRSSMSRNVFCARSVRYLEATTWKQEC
jgi:hypothetical protein